VVRSTSGSGLSDSWVGEAYYRLGLYAEDAGEIEMAIENYEKALGRNERLVDAVARLERLYRQSDEMTKAEELEDRLASLEPEYGVGQKVSEDWVLLGYDLDEEALEAGTSIEMALYWLASARVRIDGPDWYRAGERWIHVTTATNLAPNGGFEHDEIRGKRLPIGWPFRVYGAPVENHELVIEQRNGKETTAERLRNSDEHLNTGLCTADVPVEPGAVYLHSGWIRSENGGSGHLSCAWSVGGKRDYTHVAKGIGDGPWTHYGGIARPLEDAGSCRLCLINRESQGEVSFDDILFVELELPDT